MRRTACRLAQSLLALLFSFFLIPAPAQGAIEVTACGQVLPPREAGFLSADLDCTGFTGGATGAAVVLGRRGVLDLRGFTVRGGRYGVVCDPRPCDAGVCIVGTCLIAGGGTITGAERDGVLAATATTDGVAVSGNGGSGVVGLKKAVVLGSAIVSNNGEDGVRAKSIKVITAVITGNQLFGVNAGHSARIDGSTITGNGIAPTCGVVPCADVGSARKPRFKGSVCGTSLAPASVGGDWNICANDPPIPTPTLSPTPVPNPFIGTYDYQGGGTALASVQMFGGVLGLTVEFTPAAYIQGVLAISNGGAVTFDGYDIVGGDIIQGTAHANGTATVGPTATTISGTMTSSLVGTGTPFTMTRPSAGTPAAYGGTYTFTFHGLSANVAATTATLDLTVPASGFGTSPQTVPETDSDSAVRGQLSPGGCLVSPLGKLSCRLPYQHLVPPPPSFPITFFNLKIAGTLASGGTLYGDTPPIDHAFPIGSWTAVQEPAP
jgi:hypothetical protein